MRVNPNGIPCGIVTLNKHGSTAVACRLCLTSTTPTATSMDPRTRTCCWCHRHRSLRILSLLSPPLVAFLAQSFYVQALHLKETKRRSANRLIRHIFS
eukprot:gene8567-6008_t